MDLLQPCWHVAHLMAHRQRTVTHADASLWLAGGSAAGGLAGEVFYSVLVEWWLTDGEEPLPLPTATGVHPAAQGPAGSSALSAAQPLRCGTAGVLAPR